MAVALARGLWRHKYRVASVGHDQSIASWRSKDVIKRGDIEDYKTRSIWITKTRRRRALVRTGAEEEMMDAKRACIDKSLREVCALFECLGLDFWGCFRSRAVWKGGDIFDGIASSDSSTRITKL